MKETYGVWNQVFWVIFIGLGIVSILLSKFNTFILGLFVGLVIIVMGIQKITEDRNFRHLHFRQRETDKKLDEVSRFIDNTYEKVHEEPVQPLETAVSKKEERSLEKTKGEIYDTIDKLAKKMLQIENKVNQISNSIVDNWGRVQEEQVIETVKPKSKTSKKILDSNNDLKEKLKKAMGG